MVALEHATCLGSATNLNISWLVMVGKKVGFWLVFLMVCFWLVFGWFLVGFLVGFLRHRDDLLRSSIRSNFKILNKLSVLIKIK